MTKSLLYSRLYEWYARNHRDLPWRETEDGYRIWLSEVILQQTRVAQGMDYYLRFVSRWPDVESLASAKEDEVLREWKGLGYYSRARNLHKAAQMVVERGWTPFPTRYEDIRTLPGVGDYTAGAISSFAYNQPYPAMDGNVYRVVARLLDIDEAFDTTSGKKLFRQLINMLLDKENPRLFNTAIMEFGALYCTPVLGENCLPCPLQGVCAAYAHGTAELLPIRKPRPKVRDRWLIYHIYITRANGETVTLIRQRTEKDIWYHLYEFPCEETDCPENGAGGRAQTVTGAQPETEQKTVFSCTHVLSHQRLHAQFVVHQADVLPEIADTICIPWQDLDQYALSRLTLRALEHLYPREETERLKK